MKAATVTLRWDQGGWNASIDVGERSWAHVGATFEEALLNLAVYIAEETVHENDRVREAIGLPITGGGNGMGAE